MSLVYFDNNVVTINGGMIKSVIARAVDPPYNVIGGREYRTVIMPDGKEWLAENLDFKFNGLDIAPLGYPTTPAAWYYDNDESTYGVNGNKYGLLYNWYAVKYLEDNKSELIPGWHVPTSDEWDALATAVGGSDIAGTKLKSTTGWNSGNGDGSYDFEAFPAGSMYLGEFYYLDSAAFFWTITEYSSSKAYCHGFKTDASMYSNNFAKPYYSLSVRLVRDS